MAVYSIGVQNAAIGASGTAELEIFTAASDRAFLTEFWASGSFPTTASTFGFGRPAAKGITPTAPITWLAEDAGDPVGTVQVASAWATGPTAPANFFRRTRVFGNQIIVWQFPRGLAINVSASVVFWTITLGTSAAVDMFVYGEE